MAKRIKWSDQEQQKVLDSAWCYFLKHPLGSFKRLMAVAQEDLPEHRKRTIASPAQFPKLEDYLRHKMMEAPPQEVDVGVGDFQTDDLISEILHRSFDGIIKERIRAHTEELCTALKAAPTVLVQRQQTKKMPTVLIVGLKNEQQKLISSNMYNLRFASKDVPVLTKKADACILMTRFISHATQDKAKKMYSTILYCDGGITQLSRMLEEGIL